MKEMTDLELLDLAKTFSTFSGRGLSNSKTVDFFSRHGVSVCIRYSRVKKTGQSKIKIVLNNCQLYKVGLELVRIFNADLDQNWFQAFNFGVSINELTIENIEERVRKINSKEINK